MSRIQLATLFFLALMLSFGCGSSSDAEDELTTCGDRSTVAGTNCILRDVRWEVAAITSDVPRPTSNGSTTDWLSLRPSCTQDVTIEIGGFLDASAGTWIGGIDVFGPEGPDICGEESNEIISSDDNLQTASPGYIGNLDLYLFGADLPELAEYFWWNISFDRERFSFTTEVVIDSVDYQVDVTLRAVD